MDDGHAGRHRGTQCRAEIGEELKAGAHRGNAGTYANDIFSNNFVLRDLGGIETAESHAHSTIKLLPLNPTRLEGIRHGEEEQASCRP